jgi:hypothetical protein
MPVGQLDPELRIGEGLFDFPFYLDGFFFGHGSLSQVISKEKNSPDRQGQASEKYQGKRRKKKNQGLRPFAFCLFTFYLEAPVRELAYV